MTHLFPDWLQAKFFKNTFAILLVLLVIFLFYQVAFLLTPFLNFISILFTPIIISVLFYYLLRPLVYLLEKNHVPRTLAIILLYILGTIGFVLFMTYLVPILIEQIRSLADTSLQMFDKIRETSKNLTGTTFGVNLNDEFEKRIFSFLQQATTILSQNLLDVISWITRLATILAVIPFIVFYLLKDDVQFSSIFFKFFPDQYTSEARKIVKNVDTTLSAYISGLVIVSNSIGFLLLIGYALIGLDYALILSFLSVIFNSIPFVGPFLAIVPALLVGLSQSPFMTLKVLIIFVVVQQLESNIISPQVIGQQLHIHPLTIILLLMAAGSLYGLPGLLLATPAYAVSKVILVTLYKIYYLRYPKAIEEV